MNASIVLAKILGLYLIISGIGLLLNRKYYQSAAYNLAKNDGLLLFCSVIALILGLILVVFHNIWVANWPVIITVLAWLTLLKGGVRLLFPQTAGKSARLLNDDRIYYSMLAICILLGLYLAYHGFSSSISGFLK